MSQQVTPEQALQIAILHHQAGRLAEAEGIYKQVLAIQPQRVDALHLLGVLAHQVGRNDIAVDLIRQALTIYPQFAEAHYNLGNALLGLGKLQQARAEYAQAIALKPDYAEAHNNLANCLNAQGKPDEAIEIYRKAIGIRPNFIDAHFNLANVCKNLGRIEEAIAEYTIAVGLRPDFAEAFSFLGDALRLAGRLDEAADACAKAVALKPQWVDGYINFGAALRAQGKVPDAFAAWSRAVELKPDSPEAHYNLGNGLRDQGKIDEAMVAYSRAIQIKPGYAEPHYNLGLCLQEQRKLDEAAAAYAAAIAARPDFADAHNNLGRVQQEQGLIEEAIASFDRSIAARPDQARFGSNKVYALHFDARADAGMIGEEARRWNQHYAEPLKPLIQPHRNDKDAGRRLRIGYVSPDFSLHSVGRFLLPLLAQHDRDQFELFCYSDVRAPDPITERFKQLAGTWRDVVPLSDDRVAEQIREDGIDILVDLAMHTAHNRLLVFARKPAPVQVTYLAYCSTTGLETIDYRFTDPHIDPPETGDEFYSERSIRLPETYWCYEPVTSLEIGTSPAVSNGHVTFGCMNNFAKASAGALRAWSRILRDSPGSRLLLHCEEGSPRQRVINRFQSDGVDAARIDFVPRVSGQDYFQLYQSIDIALDTFPCAGGTTTCDALWMGVPVLSLAGNTAVGRTGVSILTHAGLSALVTRSEEKYIRAAVQLAKDPNRLATLRAKLRQRMQKSPLMDAPRFAKNVESAYRQMWRQWCETP